MTTPVTPIRTSPEQRYRVLVRNEHRVGEHVHLLSNTTRPELGCAWGKVTVGVDVALGADETRYSHVDGDGRVERVLRLLTRTDAEILGAGVVSRSCAMFYACSECVAEVCSCSCHKAAALKRLPAVPLSLPKPDHEEAAAQERLAEAWRAPPTDAELHAREEEDRANARTEDRDDEDLPGGDDR